ncbi:MFS transporter [Stutzerimonas stutzeri]|uniref:Acyltransferase n=1 Tax=Stutzerimonas stutzeri KOS6 TaxID=1218352 RepID=A0A061JQC3_STUST|nr:MFS transporter [Stutzerimonas stutzeri]EWC41892.1 acyltransferase [Stutzerimonas stutzeri KOS6]
MSHESPETRSKRSAPDDGAVASHSQFRLLGKRRFLPFFCTQLLGAFNDNVFKQALILAILFRIGTAADKSLLINLCALLFILPFFLFSALGGQFGERFEKAWLIRRIKFAEILIMLAGALGMLLGNLPVLLVVLFCMGTQSALFGPVKYSILPQQLTEDELVGGNALVEMGTFLAILGGTIGAGLLMASESYAELVAISVVLIALAGYLASLAIPAGAAALPTLHMDWRVLRQSWRILRLGFGQQRAVSRAMLGNSWFWFLGATYLTQIPAFSKDYLGGDESVVTLILTLFSVGIALGSLLCERLSRHHVEIGLVPFGAIGLSLCGVLLWWHAGIHPASPANVDWLALLGEPSAWWVLADILGLGVFGGLYIVPLYALIQSRSVAHERSRVVAANNILNALFMVASAIVAIVLLVLLKLSIPQLFLVVSLLSVLICGALFIDVPEFIERFVLWSLGARLGGKLLVRIGLR